MSTTQVLFNSPALHSLKRDTTSSPPQTDLNPSRMSLDGDVEIPLPGHVLRPGIPAPANARLSLGLSLGVPSTPTRQDQPTTTIRLISNPFPNVDFSYGAGENGTPQLQPFNTTFDLILGSPTPSGVFGSMSTWPPRDPEDGVQMKGRRENEAIRKKLEANRAKRRSSATPGGLQGRKSGRISTGRPSILGKPKPKPSRFGFLSSAKSLVQSVWNRGKAPAPVVPSNIPKPTPANTNASTKPASARTTKVKIGPPPLAVSSMGSKKALGGASIASRTSSTGSSSRLSSMTSRLFAPTASSLAKANGRPSAGGGGLKSVSEDRQHPPLGMITNSSALHSAVIISPNPRQIFSKPLLLPQQSGIPTIVKNQRIASNDSTTLARTNSIQRSLTGRKPRISRSKVIARLASQRAANGSGNASGNRGAGLAPRASNDTSGRTRSSLGAKVSRASYGGGTKSRTSGGGNVLMSAKKRARQSEHARRKSRVVAPLVLGGKSMDVDTA